MARQVKGRLFTRGKNKNYYLQYYINGKEIKKVLHGEDGKNITSKTKAQKAADKILAPYMAKDEVQRREQAKAALQSAMEKAKELEKQKNAILLSDVLDIVAQKPRNRKIGVKAQQTKNQHWNDFVTFIRDKYTEVKTLDQVSHKHAEKYIHYLINNGKYDALIKFKRNNKISSYKNKSTMLSPRTINGYIVSINEIFNLLADDAGIDKNPFANIPKQKLVQDTREAFSMEELKLILQNADDFIYSLFAVGLCTGLREADICLLKWKEIDLQNNLIRRITRKTGKEVTIPIMPPLMKFLNSQFTLTGNGNYVLPEHAEMYKSNPSGITWRVKKYLEGLGIKTTKVPKGRTRAVSIKDVHSLRHSFCYYAGLYNVPLAIVQAVVGHMSPEMTKHYTMHATSNDIKKAFKNMPDLFGVLDVTPDAKLIETVITEPERQELHKFADTLPIDEIRSILENIKK